MKPDSAQYSVIKIGISSGSAVNESRKDDQTCRSSTVPGRSRRRQMPAPATDAGFDQAEPALRTLEGPPPISAPSRFSDFARSIVTENQRPRQRGQAFLPHQLSTTQVGYPPAERAKKAVLIHSRQSYSRGRRLMTAASFLPTDYTTACFTAWTSSDSPFRRIRHLSIAKPCYWQYIFRPWLSATLIKVFPNANKQRWSTHEAQRHQPPSKRCAEGGDLDNDQRHVQCVQLVSAAA